MQEMKQLYFQIIAFSGSIYSIHGLDNIPNMQLKDVKNVPQIMANLNNRNIYIYI